MQDTKTNNVSFNALVTRNKWEWGKTKTIDAQKEHKTETA